MSYFFIFQRARKIFDPADHDVPSRIIKKCRTVSPVPVPARSASQQGKYSNSDAMPETNGLKELIQPVESNSDDDAELPVKQNLPPKTHTPPPPPGSGAAGSTSQGRSTRRGGMSNTASPLAAETQPVKKESWDSSAKGKKPTGIALNTPASSINGSRRRSREQSRSTPTPPPVTPEPVKTKPDKGHKQTDEDGHSKSPRNVTDTNQLAKDSKETAASGPKDNLNKKVAKEDSEFKVPTRPVTKPSPSGNKSKKPKGKISPSSTAPPSKHNKGKSSKSPTGKSSRGLGGGSVAATGEADPKEVAASCIKCELGNKKSEKLIFCKECNKTSKFVTIS